MPNIKVDILIDLMAQMLLCCGISCLIKVIMSKSTKLVWVVSQETGQQYSE